MMKKHKHLKQIMILVLTFVLVLCTDVSVFAASSGYSTTTGTAKSKDDPTDISSGSTTGLSVDGDDDELDSTQDIEGKTDINVEAKILMPGDYYSVTVEWGNMQFLFDRSGTWDPGTHTYTRSQDPCWDIDGYVDAVNNKILVKNNSNKPVDVKASYEHTLSGSASFFNADASATSAVHGYLFDNNESARTCAAELSNAAGYSNAGSVDNEWKTLKWYGASVSAEDFQTTDTTECERAYYFAFCGTPDTDKILEDWTKVGVVTVTVVPYDQSHYAQP